MSGREFVINSVDLLYYSFHKISLKRVDSNINPSDRLINKKATIIPKKKKRKMMTNAFYLI